MRVRFLSLKRLALSVALLSLLCSGAWAQEAASDAEREAVKRAVENYLYAEETDEKRASLLEEATMVFLDTDGKEVRAIPLSKRKGGTRKGARLLRSPQKIVSIDLLDDAASVKVETEFRPETPEAAKHYQYLWLVKTEAGWKIGGVLMPKVVLSQAAIKAQ